MTIEQPILLDVPNELRTPRLLLRCPRPGDGETINPAVVESIGELSPWMPWANPPPAPADTEVWVRKAAAAYAKREEFQFTVRSPDDDANCLGACGLFRIDWRIGSGEIGYWLRTSQCGRGLMTEAVNVVTSFGFGQLKLQRIEIRCDERNRRSAAVAERAGYQLEGLLRRDAHDPKGELRNTCIYARLS